MRRPAPPGPESASASAPRARRSLPWWLALFGLVAAVPTVVLLVTSALEQRRSTRLDIQEDVARLARLASLHEEHLVEATQGLLRSLARTPELLGPDRGACAQELQRLTGHLSHYTAFTLHSPQGGFLCGTVSPSGPVDLSDRDYFRQVVATLQPALGSYVLGRLSGKGTLTFGQPVVDRAGGLRAVLVAGLGLTWLEGLLSPGVLPEGTTVTVLDPAGTVLARSPAGGLVGTRWPYHPLTREIFAHGHGGVTTRGFDGVERIYAFAPFRGGSQPAAFLAVGVPTRVAYAEVDRLVARNLGWAVAVALAALGAAWALGRRVILDPIQALVRASGRLGQGDLGARSGLGDVVGEVGQLARAFDHMAEALEHREANLQAAQQIGLLGTWERDLSLDEARWSPELCRILGHPPDQPPPGLDGFLDLVHPDDRRAVKAAFAEAARGLVPLDLEYRVRRPDGAVRVLHDRGRAEPDPTGGPPRRWWGIAQDVTDRREAEAALRASEEKYRGLVESTDTGYLIVDERGTVLDANAEYARLTGRESVGRVLGRSVLEWTAPADAERNAEAIARCLAEGHTRAFEVDYLTPDGRVVPVEVNATATGAPGNRRLVTLCRDISDRRTAETARVKAEERLREAERMEAVGRLAGGVAHDFNNLLTVINGICELRLASLPPGDRLRQSFDEILQAGDRAAGLTRQLLAFSRRQVLQPRTLSLNQVVADTASMLRRLAGEDVDLRTRLAPDLGPVRADAGQLAQILLNLTANARDAMPGGGTLVVATAKVEIGADQPGPPGLAPGSYAVLTVSDTGVGMSAETRARVFEPFFTTKDVGQGTGLGLATVHGIAAQSGGAVEVESEPGQGATFRVYLPSAGREAASAEPEAPAPPAAAGTETVLVAEDEHPVRGVVRRILEGAGYRVLDAATPAEAQALSRSHPGPIHLLLTDVVMPGLNGRELADRIVAARPRIRVLFVSGHTEDEVVRRGVVEDEVAFLAKPFSGAALLRKVRQVLDAPAS
ncbi:MAG: PAS domain S-box protein [Deferrisomatales bacterium]